MELDKIMEIGFVNLFLQNCQDISILWNWTKLWKLDFSTFFYKIAKIFPYYGIGENYGNWIFQPFSTNLPKYFHTVEEVHFFLEPKSNDDDNNNNG